MKKAMLVNGASMASDAFDLGRREYGDSGFGTSPIIYDFQNNNNIESDFPKLSSSESSYPSYFEIPTIPVVPNHFG